MNDTRIARREAYDRIRPDVNKRAKLVLETLGSKEMTISEICEELVATGKIGYFNRNFVAPRMTEMKEMGIVETCGRRKATRSDTTEAVWRRKGIQQPEPMKEDTGDQMRWWNV